MMMKRISKVVALLLPMLLLAVGCEKDPEPALMPPSLETGGAVGISRFGAQLSGRCTPAGGGAAMQGDRVAFFYSSTSASLIENVDTVFAESSSTSPNDYAVTLTALQPGVTYYYAIAATGGYNWVRGAVCQFSTLDTDSPALSVAIGSVTESSARLLGEITDEGGAAISLYGFVYKEYVEGDAADVTTENGTVVPGSPVSGTPEGEIARNFEGNVSGLQPQSSYVVRAYAVNEGGKTGYSEPLILTTGELQIPDVLTGESTDYTSHSALLRGTVTADNGFAITARGFCYSAESNQPTLDHPHQEVPLPGGDGAETDAAAFEAVVDGLSAQVTYYYRAYAVNEKGVGYGEVLTFRLPAEQTLSVGEPRVSDITTSGARVEAQVMVPQGSSVVEKGVCYSSEVMSPGIEGEHVADPSEGLSIGVSLAGLQEGVTYYARAYATSRDYTYYSSVVVFSTVEHFPPTVGRPEEVFVGDDYALLRASVEDDGGLPVTRRGFCWSATASEPEADRDATVEAVADGDFSFEATLTGLEYNTDYYVRAFSENEKGLSYSSFLRIHTGSSTMGEVSTAQVGEVTPTTIALTAIVASDGGAEVTEQGFCYSALNAMPVVEEDRVAIAPLGTTDLAATLQGLSSYTTYYIRAYVRNKNGVAYSPSVLQVTTKRADPSIDDPAFPGKE